MIVSSKHTQAQRVYLDFVRAAAALCVMFGHAAQYFLVGTFLDRMHEINVLGVLIFFLISGFLISLSVCQKHADRRYGVREYAIDRFCRIYSAYLPALIFVAIADAFIADSPRYSAPNIVNAGNHYDVYTWIGNLLMLQGFPLFQAMKRLGLQTDVWNIGPFGSADTFWTMSIEWWIYMMFGMVAFFRIKAGKSFTPWQWLLFGFVAVEPIYHFVGGPLLCLTMLWGIGMAASLLFLRLPALAADWPMTAGRWRNLCLTACAASVLAAIAHLYADLFHFGHVNPADLQFGVFVATAIFSLFFALGTVRQVPKTIAAAFGFLANYSYSLYLTHLTIFWFAFVRFPGHEDDSRLFWLAIATANAVAIAFWWLFERHHRRIAARLKALFPSRTEENPAGAARLATGAGVVVRAELNKLA
jgi:peptidoglycan/LPS O-acetylase OafA/YrhL